MSARGGDNWGRDFSAGLLIEYGSAVGGGMAVGGVVGYAFATIYGYVSNREVELLRVATHVGFLGGWAVLVFLAMRLSGAA